MITHTENIVRCVSVAVGFATEQQYLSWYSSWQMSFCNDVVLFCKLFLRKRNEVRWYELSGQFEVCFVQSVRCNWTDVAVQLTHFIHTFSCSSSYGYGLIVGDYDQWWQHMHHSKRVHAETDTTSVRSEVGGLYETVCVKKTWLIKTRTDDIMVRGIKLQGSLFHHYETYSLICCLKTVTGIVMIDC